MLNIIHLRSSEFYGGPERAIIGQCTNVSGYDFTIASFIRKEAANVFLDTAQAAGIPTAEIHDSFTGDFRVVGQIKDLIRERNANILVCHDYKANFFGKLAVRRSSVRQIAHFRGYTWEDNKVKIYNSINAWLLRGMLTVLAVSNKSSRILQDMGVPAEVIKVVPNAIENSKLVQCRYGICAGRLSFEMGQDILVKAAAKL